MSARLAVYGGSFDPPHIAHVLVASWALSMGEVDAVLVLPTLEHALGKTAGATFEQRVAMCERAFACLNGVTVSGIEQTLGAPSRTYKLLMALREQHPDAQLRLVIGADIVAELPRWHRHEDIVRMAPPLVVGRAGYSPPDGTQLVMPEVSSTRVRAALAAGESVEAWVPASVRAYIREHDLYGASGDAPA